MVCFAECTIDTWKACVVCYFGNRVFCKCQFDPIVWRCCSGLFSLVVLSVTERWELTSPTIIDLSTSPFSSIRFGFVYFEYPYACVTHLGLPSLVGVLIVYHTVMSLSVPSNFLCSELFFDIIIAANLFKKLMLTWCIFFLSFFFQLTYVFMFEGNFVL